MLAAPVHRDRWLQRNRSQPGLVEQLRQAGFVSDLQAMDAVAGWAYADAARTGAHLWVGTRKTLLAGGKLRAWMILGLGSAPNRCKQRCYAAAGGGATVGNKGRGSASLKNDKGMVIEFKANETGLEVNLVAGGVEIAMIPKE